MNEGLSENRPSGRSRLICALCGNTKENKVHGVREMFYGTRECFDYVECAACGCLSIATIPRDLGRYYPDDYYSKLPHSGARQPAWKLSLKRQRLNYWLSRPNFLGRLLARGENGPWFIDALRRLSIGPDDRILDVGSGTGGLLIYMAAEGFTN